MSFAEVEKFYGQLAKKNAIGEALGKRIRSISSEPELQKFIQDEILPLARKMGYDFSEKDLLEYEKMVAQKLSPEDLLDVSGGISLKSALLPGGIFSLAMLGFGSIAPMQADAMVPKAVVESVTGGVVVDAKKEIKIREEAAQREQIQNAKNELADKLADTFLRKTENAQFMFNVAYFKRNLAEVFKYDQAGWLSLNQPGFDRNNPTVRPETSPVFQYLINIYKDFYPASTIDCSNITWDDYCNICNRLITFFNNNEIKIASSLLDECSTYGITFNEISENSIRAAINALRGEGAPAGGLEADKELVIPDTEMLVEDAKDSQEVKLSQTDYGYILDAWNGAEALVYKLTGLTENFRFLNPTNRPTLEKKDGEKYFRWKYNEDSGDGFGELMRILFPCSDGQRIVTDGGAPNVPAFSRDCKPTVKLMAQIAAMLYKYRTASDDEKAQIKQDIESLLGKISAISDGLLHDKTRNELNSKFKKSTPDQTEQNRQNIKTYETLMKEYDDLFAQVCTLFDQHKDIKAYNDSPSEDKKFNALNIIKDTSSKRLARDEERKKKQQDLLEKLNTWFKNAADLAGQDVKSFKKYDNFTALKNKMEPLLLQSIATDSQKVLNDTTLFTSGSFCDNVIHANTMLRLLTSAFYAIDNQEYEGEEYDDANTNKFAPKYFVEKMLMNFCIEHFNTADELNGFYNEAKSLIKHKPTTASLTQAKESGERIENTLKLLKKLEVSELSPYKSGTAKNGATYQIGPIESGNVTFKKDTFQDCADIAVRHVVNLLGYSVNKNWNVFFDGLLDQEGNFTEEEKTKLEARLEAFKAAAKGHTQFEFLPLKDRLQLFFYHQSKVGVDATDEITRTLWEYAICNMNDPANLEKGMYQIRYVKGNYELDTGLINSLKLVYNISKALGLSDDNKLEAAQTAINEFEAAFEQAKKDDPNGAKEETSDSLRTAFEKAATDTYQLINQAASVTSDVLSFYGGDVFGAIEVTIAYSLNGNTEMCTFGITQGPGHGYVTHDPKKPLAFTQDELKSDVDRLLAKKTSGENSYIAKKTQLNKFHMLLGDFTCKTYSSMSNPTGFQEDDPQYYKDFQALRFLKAAQGEEENEDRLSTELQQNPFVKDANIKVNLRDVQKMGVPDNKEEPLAVVVFDTYCPYKDLFLRVSSDECVKKEIDFLQKHNRIDEVLNENNFTYVIRDGEATLALYEGESSNVTIPSEINGYPVTKIGNLCFYFCDISTVTIPSSVKEIGAEAFGNCTELISIKFDRESQLKTIGNWAFHYCENLKEIIIPKSVERIKTYSFASCDKLSNISFEEREGLLEFEAKVFSAYPFSQIAFPSTAIFSTDSPLCKAKKLKTVKFTGNGEISKADILKFLPYDGAEKFFAHNIEKLFDGKDSISINGELEIDLWGGCLSEDGTLDLSLLDTSIVKTFKFAENEVVKKVIWPANIDEIPAEMFSECNSLEEITIPKTVMNIGEKAFYGCTQLKNVTFAGERQENLFVGEASFWGCGLHEVTIPDKVSFFNQVFEGSSLEKIIIETENESVNFWYRNFAFKLKTYKNSDDENLRGTLKIYVKNKAMKEKIEKDFEDKVKPENVIVGLPQGNE